MIILLVIISRRVKIFCRHFGGVCCLHLQDDWISFTRMVKCLSKTKSKSRFSWRSSLPVCQNHSFVSCNVFWDSVLVSVLRILTISCNMQNRRCLYQPRSYVAEHALPYLIFSCKSSWDTTLDCRQI